MKELAKSLENLNIKLSGGLGIDSIEKTKQWAILPFFMYMGYNILSDDVTPYYMDIKSSLNACDYILKVDGKAVAVVKCKKMGESVKDLDIDLLDTSFVENKVKLGIITDGLVYRFYCSEDNEEHMAKEPYYCFSMKDDINKQVERLYKYKNKNIVEKGLLDCTNVETFKRECDDILNALVNKNVPDWFIRLLVRKSGVTKVSDDDLHAIVNDSIDRILKSKNDDNKNVPDLFERAEASNDSSSSSTGLVYFPVTSDRIKVAPVKNFRFVKIRDEKFAVRNTGQLLQKIIEYLIEKEMLTERDIINISNVLGAKRAKISDCKNSYYNIQIGSYNMYKHSMIPVYEILYLIKDLISIADLKPEEVMVGLAKF